MSRVNWIEREQEEQAIVDDLKQEMAGRIGSRRNDPRGAYLRRLLRQAEARLVTAKERARKQRES